MGQSGRPSAAVPCPRPSRLPAEAQQGARPGGASLNEGAILQLVEDHPLAHPETGGLVSEGGSSFLAVVELNCFHRGQKLGREGSRSCLRPVPRLGEQALRLGGGRREEEVMECPTLKEAPVFASRRTADA